MNENNASPPPAGTPPGKTYWLDDPNNVRKILRALYVTCAVLIGLDLLYHKHTILDFEGWFGFYGVYGFVACVLLVLVAKQMRKLISRSEDYYGDAPSEDDRASGAGHAGPASRAGDLTDDR